MLFRNVSDLICIGFKPWPELENIIRDERMGYNASLTVDFRSDENIVNDEERLVNDITDNPKHILAVVVSGNFHAVSLLPLAAKQARLLYVEQDYNGNITHLWEIDGNKRHCAWKHGEFQPQTASAGSSKQTAA